MLDNWNCHCGKSAPEKYRGKLHEVIYCPTCFAHKINRIECPHEKLLFVRLKIANDSIQLRKICGECGELQGKSYKFSTVQNIDEVPILSENHQNPNYWDDKASLSKRLTEKEREYLAGVKRHEYRQYLNSPKWAKVRKKVLDRDGGLCQSCLSETASDVHHITYDFMGNEPCFTLVSVCRNCHEQIHKMIDGDSYENIHP